MVFLRANLDTVRERIALRNRPYEKDLLDENNPYLGQLESWYDKFYEDYDYGKKLEVDVNTLDVVSRPEDLETIVGMVREQLDLKKA